MKFGYLVLAHDAFEQLEKLATRLLRDGAQDEVFIHVDAKAKVPSGFLGGLPPEVRKRVHLLPRRTRVYWGHQSQCWATLSLLEAGLSRRFDYLHLLSGRDWPLAPREAIIADLAAEEGRCLVDLEGEQMAWRMQCFCFADRILSPRHKPRPLLWRLDGLMWKLGEKTDAHYSRRGLERSEPLGPWIKGSQWWSLPRDAAEHVRDALRKLKRSGRLRYTQCSDEHVIPTALFNSDFRPRIASNRRFTIWPAGEWSPAVLTRRDLGQADSGRYWFGRKFDAEVDDFFYEL
jgi:hypothetical protein